MGNDEEQLLKNRQENNQQATDRLQKGYKLAMTRKLTSKTKL